MNAMFDDRGRLPDYILAATKLDTLFCAPPRSVQVPRQAEGGSVRATQVRTMLSGIPVPGPVRPR